MELPAGLKQLALSYTYPNLTPEYLEVGLAVDRAAALNRVLRIMEQRCCPTGMRSHAQTAQARKALFPRTAILIGFATVSKLARAQDFPSLMVAVEKISASREHLPDLVRDLLALPLTCQP